jgi:competence protein ComEA
MESSEKLDLNAASVYRLKSLKGIGQGRAEAIVRYRDEKGPYKSTDDLDRVPHVGDMPPGELTRLKQSVTVSPADRQDVDQKMDKIDVNKANVAELRRIPGVGEAHAQAIASRREEHGLIKNLGELDELPHLRDLAFLERERIKRSLKV